MRLFVTNIILILIVLGFVTVHSASANVWIPDNEFTGFYNSNGTYTVVGAVKNTEGTSIIPTVTININDDSNRFTEKYTLSTINSQKDIPFKITIPEIQSKNAILDKPQVDFVVTNHINPDVNVVYNKTLKKYADGHETGMLVNNSTSTVYGIKVYAAIYGKDGKFLDVGKSIDRITKIDSGQEVSFSMHPDPQHTSMVSYYSCFVVGDDPTMSVTVTRDGKPYNFVYLTTGSVYDTKFDDLTHSVVATVKYPFPDNGFVNFMFPEESGTEKFSVISNGKPVDFVQSKDPDGYWHVSLTLEPKSVSHLVISGFDQSAISSTGNYRIFFLVIIPVAAAVVSIIIWKKKRD